MNVFWYAFLAAGLGSLLATAGVRRIAARIGALDMPGAGRIHRRPVPRIGGVAIAGAMYAAVALLIVLPPEGFSVLRHLGAGEISLLAGGLFVLLVGLVDDLRGVRARFKLSAHVAAATAVCLTGIRLESLHLPGLFTAELGWASWPITIFWIVAITNAMNLIDGMDGLAAGVSTIACGVILLLAVLTGQNVLALLMLALLGALGCFLAFNFPPARIFMGDCGAMFLGFVLSTASVVCAKGTGTTVGLILPGLAMGVPILDTLFSIVRRLRNRRSPFAADFGHVHHGLLGTGLSQCRAVLLVYAGTLLAVAVGVLMLFTRGATALWAMGGSVVVLLMVFLRAGGKPSPASPADKARRKLLCPLGKERPASAQLRLHFREARTFNSWWDAVCRLGDCMGFVQLSLRVTNRDGSVHKLLWRRDRGLYGPRQMLRSVIPVRDSRPGPPLGIRADIPVDGSLESADRKVALFGQLIEEHGLANLPSRRKVA